MKTVIGAIMNIGIGSEHFRKSLGGSEKPPLWKEVKMKKFILTLFFLSVENKKALEKS